MKALYRRYRPKALSEVIGQEEVTKVLSESIKSGKIGHAYLFVGPRGTGKTSVARILAHEINNFTYDIEDDYLDIIEIDAASNTGVDNIRDLREKAIIAPAQGKYKVYIIDEVHMLTKSAFNALLKTLEEPPEHVVFIMATTDAYKVPITIKSRSQTYTFKLASPSIMFDHIKNIAKQEKIKITDEALKIIVTRGGGSYRDSLSLLDQISLISDQEITADIINKTFGLPQEEILTSLLNAYAANDQNRIRNYLAELTNTGIKATVTAENLMQKIITNPQPIYLPLLDRLIEVMRSDYADAKLLLAFAANLYASPVPNHPALIQNISTSPSQTPPKPAIEDSPKKEEPKPKTEVTNKEPEQDRAAPKTEQAAAEAPTTKSEETTTKAAADTSVNDAPQASGDLWQNILATMKEKARSTYDYVADSDYNIINEKLIIYAKRDFKKKRIESKRDIINSVLPEGLSLEITSDSKPGNSDMADIAALMGGGEEITINE